MSTRILLIILFVGLVCPRGLVAALSERISPVDSPVSIILSSPSDGIDYTRDLMLTLTITSPTQWLVSMPQIRERFQGFTLAEDFTGERIVVGDQARQVAKWRLTPGESAPWRLAPFAVVATHALTHEEMAFATVPIQFKAVADLPKASGDLELVEEPIWIAPTWRTISMWGAWFLIALAGIGGAIWAGCRIRRHLKERQLTPSERAMVELDRLLSKALPTRGDYKTFYVELTLIVRRYIERSYALKASRQTTQEFLTAILADARFSQETIAELRAFLQQADMIKFAGVTASVEQAYEATAAAKDYIAQDAQTHRLDTQEAGTQ